MHLLVDLVQHYGLSLVFAVVLIEQLGIPIPSYPIIVVTAALAGPGSYGGLHVVAFAVLACLLADFAWYRIGARFGGPGLKRMCRGSLSPARLRRQTQTLSPPWGPPPPLVS